MSYIIGGLREDAWVKLAEGAEKMGWPLPPFPPGMTSDPRTQAAPPDRQPPPPEDEGIFGLPTPVAIVGGLALVYFLMSDKKGA